MSEKNHEETQAETIVGPSVKVEGELSSEGNVRIDGQVAGNVQTSQNLAVGEQAVISANVKALNAVIAGKIKGNITVEEALEITETGQVEGDITAKIISISPGAIFQGQCQMPLPTDRETEIEVEEVME
ncbi:MAG: polymer-forming cytoskeletal protein [Patescibacteria group bacterium]|nr:polymer-forming cytoskeletal protein [Patescibacteria group bacterium]